MTLQQLVDEAPVEGGQGRTSTTTATTTTPTKKTEDKERLRAEEELRDARLALEKFGSRNFMAAFWRLVAMDDPVRSFHTPIDTPIAPMERFGLTLLSL
jgi:hypothetical protein